MSLNARYDRVQLPDRVGTPAYLWGVPRTRARPLAGPVAKLNPARGRLPTKGVPIMAATATNRRHDLTVADVASHYGISTNTVRRMVAAREIPCVRIGRQLRFNLEDVKRALASNA